MKKGLQIIGKVLFYVLEVLLICYVIFITTVLLCTNEHGFTEINDKTYIIVDKNTIDQLTNYKVNDIIEVETVKYNDINVGDIVFYYDTLNEKYIARVDKVVDKMGSNEAAMYSLEAKGNSINNKLLIGEPTGRVFHSVGGVIKVLKSTAGFLFLVILPVFVLFVYQIYRTIVLIKDDDEEDDEDLDKTMFGSKKEEVKGEKVSKKEDFPDVEKPIGVETTITHTEINVTTHKDSE